MTNIYLKLLCILIASKLCESACEDKWPSCGKYTNIVCERKESCSGASGCTIMPLNEEFRRWYVEEHNRLRNEVATGKETRGGNAAAADMMTLSFDLELEYTAQCNVNLCTFKHDKCRRPKKFESAGQNLYTSTGKPLDTKDNVVNAIKNWYEEVQYTTEAALTSYSSSTKTIGHYTQLVWAKSTHVGCARAKKGNNYYLACNYGIAGNLIGSPVYTKGTACSKCPSGTACNTHYKGLCGKIDEADIKKSPLKGGRISSSYIISLGVPFILIIFKFMHFSC
nr:venom allergen 5-like [Leptinotarsa decemlineata]